LTAATGLAGFGAAFAVVFFTAPFATDFRALAETLAFGRDDVDGFDFATTFLDFEAALAMMGQQSG
jgi:hypothetical protein